MTDPEILALQNCTECLKDIDDEAKIRVLQYLINRFKLTTTPQPSLLHNSSQERKVVNHQVLDAVASEVTTAHIPHPSTNGHFPSLKDIVIKDLPKSEIEWLLVYSFYSSGFGEKQFPREEIVGLYEQTKRYTSNNRGNLNYNINSAIKKDWIKSINENEFIILEGGLTYVYEILSGKSITKPRKIAKKKKIEAE
jgi:hypothetical protein